MNCDKCHEPIDYLNEPFYVTDDAILCEPCHIKMTEPHTIIEELELCVA